MKKNLWMHLLAEDVRQLTAKVDQVAGGARALKLTKVEQAALKETRTHLIKAMFTIVQKT